MKKKLPIPFCSKCRNTVFCSPNNPLHTIGNKINSKKFLSFAKNQFIFQANETAKGIFCIYSGTIKVFKPTSSKQEITIHKATQGEIIGFNSIALGRFTNSAIAIEDTAVCFIPLSEIHHLIKLLSSATEFILSCKC